MGAWGSGSFENDSAADWYEALIAGDASAPILDALRVGAGTDADEHLAAPQCEEAIAAAEFVAAAHGRLSPSFPEDADDWLAEWGREVSPSAVVLARQALERILTESELKALWDASSDRRIWYASVNDLMSRLV